MLHKKNMRSCVLLLAMFQGSYALPLSCPAGKYCPQDTTNPVACPAGSFCPAKVSAPVPCLAGTYCPAKASAPISCQPGTYCPDMASIATPCPPGSFCSTPADDPVDCPVGSYCPRGSVAPIACLPGQYCIPNSVSSTWANLSNNAINYLELGFNILVATGTGNAQAVGTGLSVDILLTGQVVTFTPVAANTGAVAFSFGTSTNNIHWDGLDLQSGFLQIVQIVTMVFDGTYWNIIIVSPEIPPVSDKIVVNVAGTYVLDTIPVNGTAIYAITDSKNGGSIVSVNVGLNSVFQFSATGSYWILSGTATDGSLAINLSGNSLQITTGPTALPSGFTGGTDWVSAVCLSQ